MMIRCGLWILLVALLLGGCGESADPGPGPDAGVQPPPDPCLAGWMSPEICDGLDNDCDGEIDETFNIWTDPMNCGVCGLVCALPNAQSGCFAGLCMVARCAEGWRDDNGDPVDGCEAQCVPDPAGEFCDGVDNDCDGIIDNGIDLRIDASNCGVCGKVCEYPQAQGRCVLGVCTMAACEAGWVDLDGDPVNGCETECEMSNNGVEVCDGQDNECDGVVDNGFNLQTDPANCGECGFRCGWPNAQVACRDGECFMTGCEPGFADSDGEEDNGCEALCASASTEVCDEVDNDCDGEVDEEFDLATDAMNCGRCGEVCAFANAEAGCEGAICVLLACEPGFVNADGYDDNGCEEVCKESNGGVEICDGEDNDCDGAVDEEFDLTTDIKNCGVCGLRCSFPQAVAGCRAGVCVVDHCEEGYIDADRAPDNGCEYTCEETNGGVEVCDEVDNDCDGFVDEGFQLDWDVENCGVCAMACNIPNAQAICVEGECQVLECHDGFANANQDGSDGCEYPCTMSNDGLEICDRLDNDCDGQVDEGFDLMFSINHCGRCNHSCSAPNTEVSCQGGQCVVEGCWEGFVDLNGQPGDGCEYLCTPSNNGIEICDERDNDCNGQTDEGYDVMSDLDNCGVCGRACDLDHATAVCDNGACLIGECQPGYVDADHNPMTGCEMACVPTGPEVCDEMDNDCDGLIDEDFDKLNDESNCGFCGHHCEPAHNASTYCNSGRCSVMSCLPGFRDANDDPDDGCECELINGGVETCNGLDDDCSGVVDDNLGGPPLGFTCLILGECEGVQPSCVNANWTCLYPPTFEVGRETWCDGLDNDCDGLIDEDFPNLGSSCAVGLGVCRGEGRWVCNGEEEWVECTAVEHPERRTAEVCDGQDNDCDGVIDEDSDDMVRINGPHGPFLIYRYEASRPDSSEEDHGTSFDRACSRASVLPWDNVDYWTARAACEDAGHRLCSEEEWMFACQAGTRNDYPYGPNYIGSMCNGKDLGVGMVVPSGTIPGCVTLGDPIYDMSGNVWEWVQDQISPDVFAFHGGAYENLSGGLTCTYRNAASGTSSRLNIGFRCCDNP